MTAAPTAAPDVDPVLEVDCPDCGSDAPARCTSPSGRVARPHAARIRAALAATSAEARVAAAATGPVTLPDGTQSDVVKELHLAKAFAVGGDGTAEAPVEPTAEVVEPGPSKEELVLRLLVLKVLAARVAEADGEARDETVGLLDVGVSLPGYLTPEDAAAARRGEQDRCLGKVGLSRPSVSWKVKDPEKVLAWVQEHCPDEVEVRPTVRASFLAALVASCKKDGGWVHPETHELLEVPGIEKDLGRPTLQVRPSADAASLVAEALAAGLLTADGTLALPAGG